MNSHPARPASSGPHRSRRHRLIGGVVSGLWEHFGLSIDLTLFRVLVVLVSVLTVFPGILAYLLLWVLMPEGD